LSNNHLTLNVSNLVTAGGPYNHTFTLATDLSGITPVALLTGLLAGQVYVNIHASVFPGGEIRRQLIAAVPEPVPGLLLSAGLASLTLLRRRRRRHSRRATSARIQT
jgi:hypothetical protein